MWAHTHAHTHTPTHPQVISSSATTLGVSPRVQIHDDTQTGIALAMAALGSATEASVVCMGIQLLESAGSNSALASDAKKFLLTHRERYKSIPECFWNEFEALASHASASPGPKGSSRTPGLALTTAPAGSPIKTEEASGSSTTTAPATTAPKAKAGAKLKRRRVT